jgi:hypothetical protein
VTVRHSTRYGINNSLNEIPVISFRQLCAVFVGYASNLARSKRCKGLPYLRSAPPCRVGRRDSSETSKP